MFSSTMTFAQQQADSFSIRVGGAERFPTVSEIESQITVSKGEPLSVVCKSLLPVAQAYPFTNQLVNVFQQHVKVYLAPMEKKRGLLGLFTSMKDMMLTLLLLQCISMELCYENSIAIADHLSWLLKRMEEDIRVCARACAQHREQNKFSKTIGVLSWTNSLNSYIRRFHEHKDNLQNVLHVYIAFSVQNRGGRSNIVAAQLSKNEKIQAVNNLNERVDKILTAHKVTCDIPSPVDSPSSTRPSTPISYRVHPRPRLLSFKASGARSSISDSERRVKRASSHAAFGSTLLGLLGPVFDGGSRSSGDLSSRDFGTDIVGFGHDEGYQTLDEAAEASSPYGAMHLSDPVYAQDAWSATPNQPDAPGPGRPNSEHAPSNPNTVPFPGAPPANEYPDPYAGNPQIEPDVIPVPQESGPSLPCTTPADSIPNAPSCPPCPGPETQCGAPEAAPYCDKSDGELRNECVVQPVGALEGKTSSAPSDTQQQSVCEPALEDLDPNSVPDSSNNGQCDARNPHAISLAESKAFDWATQSSPEPPKPNEKSPSVERYHVFGTVNNDPLFSQPTTNKQSSIPFDSSMIEGQYIRAFDGSWGAPKDAPAPETKGRIGTLHVPTISISPVDGGETTPKASNMRSQHDPRTPRSPNIVASEYHRSQAVSMRSSTYYGYNTHSISNMSTGRPPQSHSSSQHTRSSFYSTSEDSNKTPQRDVSPLRNQFFGISPQVSSQHETYDGHVSSDPSVENSHIHRANTIHSDSKNTRAKQQANEWIKPSTQELHIQEKLTVPSRTNTPRTESLYTSTTHSAFTSAEVTPVTSRDNSRPNSRLETRPPSSQHSDNVLDLHSFYSRLIVDRRPTALLNRIADAIFTYMDVKCDILQIRGTKLIEPAKYSWLLNSLYGIGNSMRYAIERTIKEYYDASDVPYLFAAGGRDAHPVPVLNQSGWRDLVAFQARAIPDELFGEWCELFKVITDPETSSRFPLPFPRSSLPERPDARLAKIQAKWRFSAERYMQRKYNQTTSVSALQ